MKSQPTIEDLREQVRMNPSNSDPLQAVAKFDDLIAAMRENKTSASAHEDERRQLSAQWDERRDDIRFRQLYACAKTAVNSANLRYINAARQANRLLGQEVFKARGWKKAPQGGEQDV
jgi:hypothetical protein